MPVQVNLAEGVLDAGPHPLAVGDEAMTFALHLALGDLTRLPEADDAGDVERPTAHPALMAAAVHLRRQLDPRVPPPHVKRADTLRTVNLVAGDRRQVDVHRLYIERHLPEALN